MAKKKDVPKKKMYVAFSGDEDDCAFVAQTAELAQEVANEWYEEGIDSSVYIGEVTILKVAHARLASVPWEDVK